MQRCRLNAAPEAPTAYPVGLSPFRFIAERRNDFRKFVADLRQKPKDHRNSTQVFFRRRSRTSVGLYNWLYFGVDPDPDMDHFLLLLTLAYSDTMYSDSREGATAAALRSDNTAALSLTMQQLWRSLISLTTFCLYCRIRSLPCVSSTKYSCTATVHTLIF